MILIAAIWIAVTGAFFMYVPVLSVVGMALVSFGFVLMFVTGVHVGNGADTASASILSSEIPSAPGTNCAHAEAPPNPNH